MLEAPMRELPQATAFAYLLLIAPAGCSKNDTRESPEAAPSANASAAQTPSALPAPSATASAGAAAAQLSPPKCPSGLTGNSMPAFCIKLPLHYAVKDARTLPTRGSIAYETGTPTDNLMISYDERSIAEQTKDVEGEMKFGGDKLEKKGNFSGGNKWFQGSHQDYARVVTLLKGPGSLTLKCSFTYKPKALPPRDAIEACKSIVVPAGS
jgi:hypothetical protein